MSAETSNTSTENHVRNNNKKGIFWKVFWPSLVAGLSIIFISILLLSSIVGSAIGSKGDLALPQNTVLLLKLNGNITELGKTDFDFGLTGIGATNNIGLSQLLYGFKKAIDDDKIKGIFIELESASCGYATASAIRDAIKNFREKSGKFVIAYHKGEAISLKQYYIASAASENYGFHSSNFEFLGLGAELMFFKGLLDKLDVEMQVIRGPNNDFKSAVEPYFLTEMSDSSRLQVETYLNNIWTKVKSDISEDRNISMQTLDEIADSAYVKRVTHAVNYKFLDGTKYKDEVLRIIADKVEIDKIEDIKFSSFENYAADKFLKQQNIANAKDANVAVIIAEGEITVGGDGLASNRVTKLIRQARLDKNIKTIVLRVNSPGGSALASEEIWREVDLANKEKTVIVSMGDVAASGGYYIATAGSKIFAQENTITGSIGVFGVIPFTGNLFENKLGISFDRVGTNHLSSSLTTNKKFTEQELAIIQEEVNDIYNEFLQRVADGRKMSTAQVNTVARGRVWTGNDAKRIGLVDEIGGIDDAIAYAIENAGIKNPIVRYYPKVEKDKFTELMEIFGEEEELKKAELIPNELSNFYNQIKKIEDLMGIQMRMPYIIIW